MASLEIADSIVLPVDAAMVPMRWEGRAAELGDRTGDEIVSEVDEAWHRSKDEIFDVFLLCAELARIYPPKQRKQFVDCLPFDRSTFDKLKKAGRDERLFKIRNLLPPSVSSICLISRFTDDELGAALQSGLIHPGLKRAQLAGWRRARLRPSGTTGSTGVRLYAKIYQPVEELSPVAASELKKALDAIALLPGFRVDFCIMHAFKTNE